MKFSLPIFEGSFLSTFRRWRTELVTNEFALASELADHGVFWCGRSDGAANNFTVASDVTESFYSDGRRLIFKAHQANTGTATLTYNDITSVIYRPDATTLSSGDIASGAYITLLYDELLDKVILESSSNSILSGIGSVSTGLIAKTGASTYAGRTITGPAAGISVSNGDGVSGNPTLALANDLSALEALTGTGFAARTGTDTWALRTIVGDSSNIIEVTGGDGSGAFGTRIDIADRRKAGWTALDTLSAEVWTYASATTINVPTDATTRYGVGDKIHWVQSATDLYAYIIGVSSTLLTVAGDAVQNTAISGPEFSKESNPVNFPDWFAWTPSYTGFSADPTTTVNKYKILGRWCIITVTQVGNGTSNSTAFTMSAPITARTVTNAVWGAPLTLTIDNTTVLTTPGLVTITSGSGTLNLYKDVSLAGWTNSGGKRAYFTLGYEI